MAYAALQQWCNRCSGVIFILHCLGKLKYVLLCFAVWSWNLAWGRGRANEVWALDLRAYFRSDPTKGQRLSSGQVALEMPYERAPDQKIMHCWGQRSCRGQLGSTRGQIAQVWSMATKFGRANPWPKWSVMMGSKVVWGQMGVNQRSNCLEVSCSPKDGLCRFTAVMQQVLWRNIYLTLLGQARVSAQKTYRTVTDDACGSASWGKVTKTR